MIKDLFFVGVGVFATAMVLSPIFRLDVIETCKAAYGVVAGLFKKK